MGVRKSTRAALLLSSLALAGTAFGADRGLSVSIEALQSKDTMGTGQVRYTIANTGKLSLMVLRWETPLAGVDQSVFNVLLNGKAVAYVGKDVKRPAPTIDDYITLLPGESKSVVVDLTEYYDMRTTGQYSVDANAELSNLLSEQVAGSAKVNRIEGLKAATASTFVWVDGAHVSMEPDLSWLNGKAVSFSGCSNTRQTQLNTAFGSAKTYAANASSYLSSGATGARYTTWFGTYTSSRYNTVTSHYANIVSTYNTKSIVFDCGTCPGTSNASAYAYVYPTQPYKIYLCNAFWAAPNTGTDSRAGTLIHETSHFNVVAGTDDWAYGQTAAKSLARSNPTRAVDNADSHEYFAENTPFQN
jgi:peptidyl-Lys metalloendopeptidase